MKVLKFGDSIGVRLVPSGIQFKGLGGLEI